MIRIAIAEDNPFLSKAIVDQLTEFGDFNIKHIAENGQLLLDALEQDHAVDVILMDIEMPVLNGIETTARVLNSFPQISVLMLTVFDDDDHLFKAIQAGAKGYVLKDESPELIRTAIHQVMEGGGAMSPSMALKAMALLKHQPNAPENVETFDLTTREHEILGQICTGLSYTAISENLNISPSTVRKHIENVYRKLNVHSKHEAIQLAQKNRLI